MAISTMATPEQMNAVMAQLADLTRAMFAQAQAQQTAAEATINAPKKEGSSDRRKLIDSRFVKIAHFDGTPSKFDEWAFSVKRAIRSVNLNAYTLLSHVEKDTDADEDTMDVEYDGMNVPTLSAELYDIF